MNRCPSDLQLDDLEIHGAGLPAEVTDHLDRCERCRTRKTERAALQREFRDTLAAPVWNDIQARIGRRRWLWALGPAVVAAAASVLLMRPRAAELPVVGVKGAVGVDLQVRRGERQFPWAPEVTLTGGDELRLRVRAPGATHLVIGSVDGSGRFSPFFPPSLAEPSVLLPRADEYLPGGITLDDAPGPERLLIVTAATPLSAASVARAAEARASTLTNLSAIDDVPVTSVWLVLAKQERR